MNIEFTPCPDIGYHHILDYNLWLALRAVAAMPSHRPLRPWHHFPRNDWSRQ